MDKDKELNDMMEAIKNLKNHSNISNPHSNINNNINDDGFYTRNYKINEELPNIKSEIKENVDKKISLEKHFDDYINSIEFSKKMEDLIKISLIKSVQNQDFLEKLVTEIIKEYTNLNENIEKQINFLIKNEITKLIKNCSNNLAKTLENI
jgi:hypothetical protein